VAGVGECPDHRKARYRGVLASGWVSPRRPGMTAYWLHCSPSFQTCFRNHARRRFGAAAQQPGEKCMSAVRNEGAVCNGGSIHGQDGLHDAFGPAPLSMRITAMVDETCGRDDRRSRGSLDRDQIRPTRPRGTWRSGGMRTLRRRDAKHHRMLRLCASVKFLLEVNPEKSTGLVQGRRRCSTRVRCRSTFSAVRKRGQ
jgi:hypothetical protein